MSGEAPSVNRSAGATGRPEGQRSWLLPSCGFVAENEPLVRATVCTEVSWDLGSERATRGSSLDLERTRWRRFVGGRDEADLALRWSR